MRARRIQHDMLNLSQIGVGLDGSCLWLWSTRLWIYEERDAVGSWLELELEHKQSCFIHLWRNLARDLSSPSRTFDHIAIHSPSARSPSEDIALCADKTNHEISLQKALAERTFRA